jgi:hypothetical protein
MPIDDYLWLPCWQCIKPIFVSQAVCYPRALFLLVAAGDDSAVRRCGHAPLIEPIAP